MKKEYTMNDVVKILIENGYEAIGWKGGHLKMKRGAKTIHISRNTRLNQHYVHTILKKAGIDYNVLKEQ